MGGGAPRILCLDDYFMVEQDKKVEDESGKMVTQKVMEYEYEPDLEETYRVSLIKSFKKQVDDGYFNFIIIDCVNERRGQFNDMVTYGKSRGFTVSSTFPWIHNLYINFQFYIIRMDVDAESCLRQNIHNRSLLDIKKIISNFEENPSTMSTLDIRSLLQADAIQEVGVHTFLCNFHLYWSQSFRLKWMT